MKYLKNFPQYELKSNEYPMIYPDWDNSPRSGKDGWMFLNSSPKAFSNLLEKAKQEIEKQSENKEKILIIKSWNEWAEGNYLEPDSKFGNRYLEVLRNSIQEK